ncbi:MAG: response regulator transcription factor [Clostridia bacterium]|nr:response regulator transcription factor [Clostridia bacterium]
MHTAICGASAPDAAALRLGLQRYADRHHFSCLCDSFDSVDNLVYELTDDRRFDLLFLDADEQPVAAAIPNIRQAGFDGKLILLSHSTLYAVLGYDWQVSGYLLKPCDPQRLTALLDRLLHREDGVYYLQTRTGTVRLSYDEIVFVESRNSKCLLHSQSGRIYTVYTPLAKIEAALHDRRFLRCHQSYLINMDHVTAVDRQFSLISGDRALIRCKQLRAIQHQYLDYIREKER